MAKDKRNGAAPEAVVSIIGPGMELVGDCQTDGTIRIEGEVEGTIRAGKAVVVGKDGVVDGNIFTEDAVISGRIRGSLEASSRLEVHATARIEGDVSALRMQLDEGAILNGTLRMGQDRAPVEPPEPSGASEDASSPAPSATPLGGT